MDPPSLAPPPMLELEPELSVPLNANLEFLIHSKDIGEGWNFYLFSSGQAYPWHHMGVCSNPIGASLRQMENSLKCRNRFDWQTWNTTNVLFFFFFFLLLLILFDILKSYFIEESRDCSGTATQKPFSLLRGRENDAFTCACACVSVCEYVVGCMCICTFN